MACSLAHEKSGINPRMSRIRIEYRPEEGQIVPRVCRLCTKPACVEACPEEALSRHADSGIILVDEGRCTGCGACVQACAFGGISIHPERHIAIVCDFCGGNPQCVHYCMNGTLSFATAEVSVEATAVASTEEGRVSPKEISEKPVRRTKQGRKERAGGEGA
jgi:Fe-S-cluster-containing hydrogenase component 2